MSIVCVNKSSIRYAGLSKEHDHYFEAAKFLIVLLKWAWYLYEVRALILVGSFARGEARPDSDIDIRLIVSDPDTYTHDFLWLRSLGSVTEVAVRRYGRVTSLEVVFVDLPRIEFGISDTGWALAPNDSGAIRSAREGMLVLMDRDGNSTDLSREFRKSAQGFHSIVAALEKAADAAQRS